MGDAHDQDGKAHHSDTKVTNYTEKVRAGRASMRRRVALSQLGPWLERVDQVSGALAETGKEQHKDKDYPDKVRAGRARTR